MILWKLSWKSLWSRRSRTLLTVLSIAAGVAAVVAVLQATLSTRARLQQLHETMMARAALEVVAVDGKSFAAPSAHAIQEVPGVKAAVFGLRRFASVRAKQQRAKVEVLGIDFHQYRLVRDVELVAGRAYSKAGEICLEVSIADRLGVGPGDSVRMRTRSSIRPQELRIAGVFRLRGASALQESAVVLMPLEQLQRSSRASGLVSDVQILLDKGAVVESVSAALAQRLAPLLLVRRAESPADLGAGTEALVDQGLGVAVVLSVVAAMFIVLNTFMMSVIERQKQLALMRVVGAIPQQIRVLLLRESLLRHGWASSHRHDADSSIAPAGIAADESGGNGPRDPGGRGGGIPADAGHADDVPRGPATDLDPARTHSRRLGVRPADHLGGGHLSGGKSVQDCAIGGPTAVTDTGSLRSARWLGASRRGDPGVVEWSDRGCDPRSCAGRSINPGRRCRAEFLCTVPTAAAASGVACHVSAWQAVFFPVEMLLAHRQILRNVSRSTLTIGVLFVVTCAGMSVGTSILEVVHDVDSWFERTIVGDFLLRTSLPRIDVSQSAAMPNDVDDAIERVPGIKSIDRFSFISVRVNDRPALFLLRDIATYDRAPIDIKKADPVDVRSKLLDGQAVIGSVLAHQLQVATGDDVTVAAAGKSQKVRVVAIVGEYTSSGSVIMMDRRAAQRLFAIDAIHGYMIKCDPGATQPVGDALGTLAHEHGLILQSLPDFRQTIRVMVSGITGGMGYYWH
jgi:putative ABC transport system permease protein